MGEEERIAELYLQPGETRSLTTQQGQIMVVFVFGEGILHTQPGQRLRWEREDMLILQPGQRVKLESAESLPQKLLRLTVTEEQLKALSDEKTDLLRGFYVYDYGSAVIRAEAQTAMLARHICQSLMKEQRRRDYGSAILERGMLSTLLVLVLRSCIAENFQGVPKKRSPFLVSDLFVYIREHLTEKITLQDLERHFYVSHEHIAREFKRQTGQTVHQYILTLRLERGCGLLRQGCPVTEIWQQCGFESYTYFFQAFRRRYGMTPMEYVRRVREEDPFG